MRYEGTRPSGRDPQVEVFKFSMGIGEVNDLIPVIAHYVRAIPQTIETDVLRMRLLSIRRGLLDAKMYHKLSKRNVGNGPAAEDNTTNTD